MFKFKLTVSIGEIMRNERFRTSFKFRL